eukprot:12799887-Alexandrium_andersonii.AAC.1
MLVDLHLASLGGPLNGHSKGPRRLDSGTDQGLRPGVPVGAGVSSISGSPESAGVELEGLVGLLFPSGPPLGDLFHRGARGRP